MKYVIKQKNFAYDDECFSLVAGKSIHKIYHDEAEAKKALIALEKELWEHMPLTERQTLQIWKDAELQKSWQGLIDKLKEYGISIAMPKGLFTNKYVDSYLTDKDLQLDTLTDEQLYAVMQASESENFILTQYDDAQKLYTIKFTENALVDFFQGYFSCADEYSTSYKNIIVAESEDTLLIEDFFIDVYNDNPIASVYTEKDASSPLVKSLLEQHKKSFVLFEGAIYYIDDGEHAGIKALKAMNAVLENPFYEIVQHTPEEILALQNDDTVLKTDYRGKEKQPERFQRYLKFVESNLDEDDVETETKKPFWKRIFGK